MASSSAVCMDPCDALSSSVFREVLGYLSYTEILQAEQVCKRWCNVIRSHEKSIWRAAYEGLGISRRLIYHLQIESPSIPPELKGDIARSGRRESSHNHPMLTMDDRMDYRATLRNRHKVRTNWKEGHVRERWITTPRNAIWRFKVDPEESVIITTSQEGAYTKDARL